MRSCRCQRAHPAPLPDPAREPPVPSPDAGGWRITEFHGGELSSEERGTRSAWGRPADISGPDPQGEIIFRLIENGAREGIEIIALDEGPGICDVLAGDGGSDSTSDSLGLGFPGIRRLMDEFKIISRVGDGTTVIV